MIPLEQHQVPTVPTTEVIKYPQVYQKSTVVMKQSLGLRKTCLTLSTTVRNPQPEYDFTFSHFCSHVTITLLVNKCYTADLSQLISKSLGYSVTLGSNWCTRLVPKAIRITHQRIGLSWCMHCTSQYNHQLSWNLRSLFNTLVAFLSRCIAFVITMLREKSSCLIVPQSISLTYPFNRNFDAFDITHYFIN